METKQPKTYKEAINLIKLNIKTFRSRKNKA